MTLSALLLRERYFSRQAPRAFKYGTTKRYVLGLEAVQSVVLSVQVIDWAREAERSRGITPPGNAAFNWEGFWRHSIATACCA